MPDKSQPISHRTLEFGQPVIDQKIPDVQLPWLCSGRILERHSQGDYRFRHNLFRLAALLGQILHDMPVTVAGPEIHPGIDPGRVAAQHGFGHTKGFNKLPPVDGVQGSETGDGVADGYLVGGLVLALRLLNQLDRLPLLRQFLFNPIDGQPDDRVNSLDVGIKFGDKRR